MGAQGIRTGKRLTPPSDEDWRRFAAMVARYLPGLGNPMDMELPEIESWSTAMAEILRRENGDSSGVSDHRARVEADMRRLHQ
jgi:hypothetical protein